ncbi:MAG: class I SAM-dependent methyltransferase [Phycisphaeraceae bacterium]
MSAVVAAEGEAHEDRAQALSQWLQERGARLPEGMRLSLSDDGLSLRDGDDRRVRADWESIDIRSGAGRSQRAPVYRAIASKSTRLAGLRVLDATAGWGEDALLLLATGCVVTAIERDPVIALLLADTARRAEAAGLIEELSQRLTVLWGESASWLQGGPAEVLYGQEVDPSAAWDAAMFDPMFAAERKAAERQAMRSLRAIVSEIAKPANDDSEVLRALLESGIRRVAVKRSRKAPAIPHLPSTDGVHHVIEGKGFRFDVYLRV